MTNIHCIDYWNEFLYTQSNSITLENSNSDISLVSVFRITINRCAVFSVYLNVAPTKSWQASQTEASHFSHPKMKFHQKFQIINKVFILLLLLMVFGYFYYANELVKAEKLRLEIQESKFSKFRDVYDGYHYSKYNEYWKKMTRQDILKLRSEWQEFVADVKPRENVLLNKTRGIVYTCHDGIAKLAIVSILMLRKRGCELPIEVWHYGNELGQKEIEALLALKGVMVKDLALVSNNMISKPSADDKMFEAKGAALINSEFDEILFLDSDVTNY